LGSIALTVAKNGGVSIFGGSFVRPAAFKTACARGASGTMVESCMDVADVAFGWWFGAHCDEPAGNPGTIGRKPSQLIAGVDWIKRFGEFPIGDMESRGSQGGE
jgi:hypothetical protein